MDEPTKFFFQATFAAVALAIVWGTMLDRTKFGAYLPFAVVFVGVIYPLVAHWVWGGGWLADHGFLDFAGSGVVHVAGASAALAGAIIIGPRLGKYRDGKPTPIPGHSMPLARVATGAIIPRPDGMSSASWAGAALTIGLVGVDTTGVSQRVVITATNQTRLIGNGVTARVVRDVVTEKRVPVEITDDWYAQDRAAGTSGTWAKACATEDGKPVRARSRRAPTAPSPASPCPRARCRGSLTARSTTRVRPRTKRRRSRWARSVFRCPSDSPTNVCR